MIGFLDGRVISISRENQQCVLAAYRVGFELNITKRLAESITLQSKICLWVHTHVREDALTLYGFPNECEKQIFRLLLSVSGLGPKTALSLISEHGVENLIGYIATQSTSSIAKAPGVGKKIAERIILDLRSKIQRVSLPPIENALLEGSVPEPKSRSLKDDLTGALLNLGFSPAQVKQAIEKMALSDTQGLPFETCLKTALKDLSVHVNRMPTEVGNA